MSPYATNTLAALRTKHNLSPYEQSVLQELVERDAAEQAGEISTARKYTLSIGGEPVTENELAYLAALMRRHPPTREEPCRPSDCFEDFDWTHRTAAGLTL